MFRTYVFILGPVIYQNIVKLRCSSLRTLLNEKQMTAPDVISCLSTIYICGVSDVLKLHVIPHLRTQDRIMLIIALRSVKH